jgi:hypothetical protein
MYREEESGNWEALAFFGQATRTARTACLSGGKKWGISA